MKKGPSVKKTKAELHQDLSEQIELLCIYCEAFDSGKQSMAKPISAALKILLYGNAGKSLALLHQLGMRDRRFVDTAPAFADGSTFAKCQLAGIYIAGDTPQARYIPMLSSLPHQIKQTSFVDWWMRPVIRDIRGRSFSRLELVQEVRDTDGGAHLDAELSEAYSNFKSGKYMGWKLKTPAGNVPIAHPHLACMRQIAHETLLTLQQATPDSFKHAYVFPEDPSKDLPGVFMYGTEVKGAPGTYVPVLKVGDTELIGEV